MKFNIGKKEGWTAEVVRESKRYEKFGFEGKNLETLMLVESKKFVICVENFETETLKTAGAKITKSLKEKTDSLNVRLPKTKNLLPFIEGLILGDYEFDKYKTEKAKHIEEVNLIGKIEEEIIEEAQIRAEAVKFTRDIINSIPDEITPPKLASIAQEIAKENRLGCKIYDENYLYDNGYHSFYSVAKASTHPPRLIHLTYKPKKAKRKIVLVGKGLCYDSGGLSLKPADYMVTMKSDKSGAVTVLGIIKAVSKLNLDVEVHAILGAAENMIGGNAYKPDDVLKAKNGKTIEVRNTDAEGRLVLADCLCYADEEIKDYDLIFDFATLTGACVVGLGEYTAGVMGYNQDAINQVLKTSTKTAENFAYLPFNNHLKELLKSKIADICNIASSRYGGALTAGLFLSEFVEQKDKWVHFDIAGPAFVEKEWGWNSYGASGFGIETIVEFLKGI